MPILTLQLPNFPPVEHVLKDDAVTIGRMKGNAIALDDISVSLSHAKLTKRDGEYYLKDLNSTNGTMVNGQSITEVRLRDGDHVKFGEVSGRFHLTPNPAPPSPVASIPVAAASSSPAIVAQVSAAKPLLADTPPASPPSNPPSAPAARPVSTVSTTAATTAVPAKNKKNPWLSLGLKAAGMMLLAVLLWKMAFQPAPAPVVPPPRSAPATTVPTAADKSQPPAPITEPAASAGVPGLIRQLKSPDVQERRRAVSALNAMRTEALAAAPALREALKDADAEVRMWAALSLVSNRIYDPAAVPILIQTLQHENATLRQVACLSLALFPYDDGGKEPVIAALTDCASNDSSQEVRNAALSALKMVAHEPAASGK